MASLNLEREENAMEYHRMRKPLVERLGGSTRDQHSGGSSTMTKGALVKRLERSRSAKEVIAGLQAREVVRGGKLRSLKSDVSPNGNHGIIPRSTSSNSLGSASSHSRIYSNNNNNNNDHQSQHQDHTFNQKKMRAASASSYLNSGSSTHRSGSTASLPASDNAESEAVARARQRFEEKIRQRKQIQLDLEALREQEAEGERLKQERRRRVFDKEREERSKQLIEWKRSVQAEETQKKRKEQRRKEKHKRELDRGLKERQQRYAQQLREHEEANRHKRPTKLPPIQADASKYQDLAADLTVPVDFNSRIHQIKSSYEVNSANNVKHAKQRASQIPRDQSSDSLHNNNKGSKRMTKKSAKKMSDSDIVEMARQIVQNGHAIQGAEDFLSSSDGGLLPHDMSFLKSPAPEFSLPFAPTTPIDGEKNSLIDVDSVTEQQSSSLWDQPIQTKTSSDDFPSSTAFSDVFSTDFYSAYHQDGDLLDTKTKTPQNDNIEPAASTAAHKSKYMEANFHYKDQYSTPGALKTSTDADDDMSSNIEDWYRKQIQLGSGN